MTVKTAGSDNIVKLIDEIDDMGWEFKGNPESTLLEILYPV